MADVRWRKAARDLWLHKARSALAVSAISIGLLGAGTLLDAWSLVRRATHEEFGASHAASATIRADSITADALARVRAMPAIAAVQARRTILATVTTRNGSHTAFIVARNNYVANDIGVLVPSGGAWPPSNDGVVLEHSSVDFSESGLGDTVSLRIGTGETIRVPVTGIVRDVGVAPGWMEHVVYLFATPVLLGRLGAPVTMNELQLLVRDTSLARADIERIARSAGNEIERAGQHVSDVSVPVPGRHVHSGQIESLLLAQGAFGILALLLSGVVVVNLISAMLTGQVREIGVMKAMGGDVSQVAAMYLGVAVALGLVASVICIPLAAVAGRAYAGFTGTLLNFDVAPYSIPLWVFASQLAAGMLLPPLAAAFPVLRGCRIPVTDALRDQGADARADQRAPRMLNGLDGIGRPVVLSLRNAFRRRQRMILTLGTLALGGGVYLAAFNLRTAVNGAVDLMFAPQKFDLVLRLQHPHAVDSLLRVARAINRVDKVEVWSGARATRSVNGGPVGNAFGITAPPAATSMLEMPMSSGRSTRGDAQELVVNRTLVEDDSAFSAGRDVTLLIDGKTATWRVVGVTSSGVSPTAFTSREALARLRGADGGSALAVVLRPSSRAAQLESIRELREALSDAGLEPGTGQLMSEQRTIIEDHLLMVAGFLGNMSLLAIIVGGMALASTMGLSVLERTREIGIMRAIGASHASIMAMVQVEGLLIALLGWALAFLISIPASVALERAFGRIMIPLPVHVLPELGGSLRWLAVVVVLSLVACAWPARRATTISTARALTLDG